MERLPQLNYSLLNDNALRKKLSGLGMPVNGSRGRLIRRHTEWVNLVNSNCDSMVPKDKRELLHELDLWERSQGRQAINNSSGRSVMDKDFDGAGWALKHNDEFQKLIAKAKGNGTSQKAAVDVVEGQGDECSGEEAKFEDGTAPKRQEYHHALDDVPSSASKNESPHYIDQNLTTVYLDLDKGG